MKTPKNASRAAAAASAPQVGAGAPLDGEILTPGAAPGSSPADGTAAGTKSDAHSSQAATDHPAPEEQGSGTNTPPASEEGDAASEASAELVKPSNSVEPTSAIPAEAAPVQPGPKTEASVFGRFNFTPEELERISAGIETPEDIIWREVCLFEWDKAPVVSGTDTAERDDAPAWGFIGSKADFRRKYPLLAAAFDNWDYRAAPTLRVTSKKAGFWRAGLQHPTDPVDHDIGNLTPDQAEAILAEPMLVVELI